MSGEPTAPPSRRRRGCLVVAMFGLAGLVCAGTLGITAGIQTAFELALGWIAFAAATLPAVRPNPKEAAITLFAFVALVAGGHAFLRWLQAARAGETPVQSWSPRWTLTIAAGVVLMFAASLSWGGLVHNTGWLLTEPSLLDNNWETIQFDARRICQAARRVHESPELDLHRELRSSTMIFRRADGAERYHVALAVGSDGRLSRAVVFPRDPERLRREGVADCALPGASGDDPHRDGRDLDLDALIRSLR